MDWLRELERPEEGRLLAGVCAALANRLEMDVTLLRLAFLVLAMASGIGVVLYLLCWLAFPGAAAEGRAFKGVVRGNMQGMRYEVADLLKRITAIWSRQERSRWPRPLSRRWVAVGLMAGGGFVLLWSLGIFSWLGTVRSIGLAAIAVGASVLITLTPELRR